MVKIQVELSGGDNGGAVVEWETKNGTIPDHEEKTFEFAGRKFIYRYVPDKGRPPHAVYCGEVKEE